MCFSTPDTEKAPTPFLGDLSGWLRFPFRSFAPSGAIVRASVGLHLGSIRPAALHPAPPDKPAVCRRWHLVVLFAGTVRTCGEERNPSKGAWGTSSTQPFGMAFAHPACVSLFWTLPLVPRDLPQPDRGEIRPPSPGASWACPSPCLLSPASHAFLQSSFSLRSSWLADSLTKNLNEATGGRRLIKMNLFALHPGCHLGATLSSQKAKQNSCTHTCSCTPVHTHRPDACQGPCAGGVGSIIFYLLALIATLPILLLCPQTVDNWVESGMVRRGSLF